MKVSCVTKLFIAVYKVNHSPVVAGERDIEYVFRLGRFRELGKRLSVQTDEGGLTRFSRMSMKRVSLAWQRELLSQYFRGVPNSNEKGAIPRNVIGYISYSVDSSNTARAQLYYPKSLMFPDKEKRLAPGLGYYLEALSVHNLRTREGVARVTRGVSSKARENQVFKAGLPLYEPASVREWLEGMGRGIRMRRRL